MRRCVCICVGRYGGFVAVPSYGTIIFVHHFETLSEHRSPATQVHDPNSSAAEGAVQKPVKTRDCKFCKRSSQDTPWGYPDLKGGACKDCRTYLAYSLQGSADQKLAEKERPT